MTLIGRIAVSDEQISPADQTSQGKDKFMAAIPLYLVRQDKGVVEPLNVPARNAMVHKSPALLKQFVAEALQSQANKDGFFEGSECFVRWRPSVIPYHIEFNISASDDTCQHLASVRGITEKDPVSMFASMRYSTDGA